MLSSPPMPTPSAQISYVDPARETRVGCRSLLHTFKGTCASQHRAAVRARHSLRRDRNLDTLSRYDHALIEGVALDVMVTPEVGGLMVSVAVRVDDLTADHVWAFRFVTAIEDFPLDRVRLWDCALGDGGRRASGCGFSPSMTSMVCPPSHDRLRPVCLT
jgi:hypothetical protein